jgi:poly-gamma-glutamate synthesis protein (capsule biosynthesis protein)
VYSNRQPERISRVALTGVTALTRATAYQMEIYGINYPGEEVAPLLQAVDIAHVSHETAFSPDCPYPNPLGGTSFCARDSYLGLLQYIGIDVVELTGNHVNDYGATNLARSVAMYVEAGMQVYGGGRDLAEAARPALFEVNGNRVAFVGCNPAGPNYAWATVVQAGANPCDDEALYAQIATLRAEGYIVLATLQYQELYDYLPTAAQRADFRALLAAGAHAVSGSQGHHAMTFDLYQGGFIHYGPGNLFFDQMQMLGTRETFIDTYVIHDGRLLSVELWTGLIENYARPRLMSAAERAATLGRVFAGSRYEP